MGKGKHGEQKKQGDNLFFYTHFLTAEGAFFFALSWAIFSNLRRKASASMSAAVAEAQVKSSRQKADNRESKGSSGGGAAHGENGRSTTARYGRKEGIRFFQWFRERR